MIATRCFRSPPKSSSGDRCGAPAQARCSCSCRRSALALVVALLDAVRGRQPGADARRQRRLLDRHRSASRFGTLQAAVLVVGLTAMADRRAGAALHQPRQGDARLRRQPRAGRSLRHRHRQDHRPSPGSPRGFLAGLAGILYATAIGTFNPNFGITLLLSLFAATVLGGIGNAYGALVGGLVIGLSQEWSTLFFNPRWKPAVGFALLILIAAVHAARHIRPAAKRRS